MKNDFGSMAVVNLFALRATNPKELETADDPVGPENDGEIAKAIKDREVVVAFGSYKKAEKRWSEVKKLFGAKRGPTGVSCLGTTNDGSPKHPLYLSNSTLLVAFDWKGYR